MKEQDRACALALCLGPCRSEAQLKEQKFNLEAVAAYWPHRRAHSLWDQARDPRELLLRAGQLLDRLEAQQVQVIFATEEHYPAGLRRLADAPSVLYVRGSIPVGPAVAMVGARAAYRAGTELAHTVASALAGQGITVVSGGAIGIDTASHQGALAGGGQTVSILGSALDRPYPQRNLALFRQLATHGAVVSSFAPGTPPHRGCFPRRNRLIAALADAVLVVQAGARSGALQTAGWARRLGLPILAGDSSPGGRQLLLQGAGLLSSAEDVLRLLAGEAPAPAPAQPLTEDQRVVLEQLGTRRLSADQVARKLGWGVARVAGVLVGMEVEGRVRLVAGGRYCVGG